ncbi:class A beta-lactamase-related serine hydrolase [Streptomyces sp. RY43-2]|uniref:Class A beta-lactamase-related serine hydrolase n=1 Tax=Streptomyces macrolidinus TaxID=2952607 RepID=A0ABT0ZIL3_9ACTN|nr:serine hydrolase [Streptomyces macrolidinus]MCN9243386.1 class A beta-lactamase-related serine hydrolase [Streptomyces macrolidinus]
MPYRLFSLSRPHSMGGHRGRRAVACAGVILASVTTFLSLDAITAEPARAATSSSHTDTHEGAAGPMEKKPEARVTAAVLSLDGAHPEPTVYGADTPYDTASIIKVDILAAVLLQAQDEGRSLTPQEEEYAKAMIEHSDNDSTSALWRQIGLAPGLEAANKRLGLTATKGGPGPLWGLTQTTASDQIRLLRVLFDTGPATHTKATDATDASVAKDAKDAEDSTTLNEASRAYIRTLMAHVADDQAWGVSAAGPGAEWALKNGWLQRSTTGLWDINSVGQVTVEGHRYLVAVLSDGNTSMKDGISVVEHAARTAVSSASAR